MRIMKAIILHIFNLQIKYTVLKIGYYYFDQLDICQWIRTLQLSSIKLLPNFKAFWAKEQDQPPLDRKRQWSLPLILLLLNACKKLKPYLLKSKNLYQFANSDKYIRDGSQNHEVNIRIQFLKQKVHTSSVRKTQAKIYESFQRYLRPVETARWLCWPLPSCERTPLNNFLGVCGTHYLIKPTPEFLVKGAIESADFCALKFQKRKNLDHNEWYKLLQIAVKSL